MDVPAKLLKYRNQFIIAVSISVALSLLLYAAPRLATLLAYFWPLFASTAVLLVSILAFGGVSQLSMEGQSQKTGERILDYVAGQPEPTES